MGSGVVTSHFFFGCMKRFTTLLFALTLFLVSFAQEGRFGYLNFDETIMLMPEYKKAEDKLQKLQDEYSEEISRQQNEFYRQYTEYLHGQKLLSQTIIMKRQKELQLLYDENMEFNRSAKESLAKEREALLEPIKVKLLNAINRIGKQMKLDYVIDMGSHSYLFINQDKGIDISVPVYRALGISVNPKEKKEE